MRQPPQVTATFYAQIKPDWAGYVNSDGERQLRGAKVESITQSRPRQPKGGTVLVKLSIQVPAGAFLPLRPEVIVVVPDSMAETTPITVEAQDPS